MPRAADVVDPVMLIQGGRHAVTVPLATADSPRLALLVTILLAAPAYGQTPSGDGDDKVTGQPYVRHDGGSDTGIAHCNNAASNPTPVDPSGGDADPNDGGSRRQGNEPFVAIDPTNPNLIVAGWNDYCLTDLGAGWQGFAYSLDAGETWTNSIVPGYPQDTSPEGVASPLYGDHTDAGDPVGAFDTAGNLYVGGIAFNRVKPRTAMCGSRPTAPLRTPAATRSTTCARASSARARRPRQTAASSRTRSCWKWTAPAARTTATSMSAGRASRVAARTRSSSAARPTTGSRSPSRSPSRDRTRSSRCRAVTSRWKPTATCM